MKNVLIIAVSLLLWLGVDTAAAQEMDQAQQKTSIVIAHTGKILQLPSTATYHYFADGIYHEAFVGSGATLYDGKWLTLTGELYFAQASGPAAHNDNARYLWPWALFQYRLSDQVGGKVVYFPCLPPNGSATIQYILGRTKVEYKVSNLWRFGLGYSGYKFGDQNWQHEPFLTTTFNTSLGKLELWLQRLSGNSQVQIRYQYVY
jgi:opacity protein-like surface antigen